MSAQKSILVVEDDDVVRMLTTDVLEELGYRVIAAADSGEALASLEEERPMDLLLTDVGLPGMSGPQLAEAARRLQPDLPVLFASGYVQDSQLEMVGDGDLSRLSGPLGVIGKPFTLDQLRDKVSEMLRTS